MAIFPKRSWAILTLHFWSHGFFLKWNWRFKHFKPIQGQVSIGFSNNGTLPELCRIPRLCITAGIGSDHVDLDAACRHGVTVAEVTYCNSISVAEHVPLKALNGQHRIEESGGVLGGLHSNNLLEGFLKIWLVTPCCCPQTIEILKHGLAIAALCEPRERERENRCVCQINEIPKYCVYAMGMTALR